VINVMGDFFERLGLPRRFAVEAAVLERAYLDHSRAVHPDFHAQGHSGELAASERLAAEVNEAYATLKDSFRRAEHLLALLGGQTATQMKEIAPAFLMEMMEIREQIETADVPGKEQLEADLVVRYTSVFHTIEGLFERNDLTAIRKELNAAKYLKGLLRDLRND
jgi:molecular chaperone HscB